MSVISVRRLLGVVLVVLGGGYGLLGYATSAAKPQLKPTAIALHAQGVSNLHRLHLVQWFEHTAAANGWVVRVIIAAEALAELNTDSVALVVLTTSARAALSSHERLGVAEFLRSGGGLMVLNLDTRTASNADKNTNSRSFVLAKQRHAIGLGRRLSMTLAADQLAAPSRDARFAGQVRGLAQDIRWARAGSNSAFDSPIPSAMPAG